MYASCTWPTRAARYSLSQRVLVFVNIDGGTVLSILSGSNQLEDSKTDGKQIAPCRRQCLQTQAQVEVASNGRTRGQLSPRYTSPERTFEIDFLEDRASRGNKKKETLLPDVFLRVVSARSWTTATKRPRPGVVAPKGEPSYQLVDDQSFRPRLW